MYHDRFSMSLVAKFNKNRIPAIFFKVVLTFSSFYSCKKNLRSSPDGFLPELEEKTLVNKFPMLIINGLSTSCKPGLTPAGAIKYEVFSPF